MEEGQAKISRASKITNGVGDVAGFVLSAKGLIDLAVQSMLQAALPWAGVCVGLRPRVIRPLSRPASRGIGGFKLGVIPYLNGPSTTPWETLGNRDPRKSLLL